MAYDPLSAPVDTSTSAYQDFVSQISHFGADIEGAQSDGNMHAALHGAEEQMASWMHDFLNNALPKPSAPQLAPPESGEWYRHSSWLFSSVGHGAKATMEPEQPRPTSSAQHSSEPKQTETIQQRRLKKRLGDLNKFPTLASTPNASASDASCFTASLLSHNRETELEEGRAGVPHVSLHQASELESAPKQQPQSSTNDYRKQESHTSTETQPSTATHSTKRRHRHCSGASESSSSMHRSSSTNDDSTGTQSFAPTKSSVEAKHSDDSGTMRYFCPDEGCDKHFSTSGHARRHARKHEGLLPFECPHRGCCATFTRRDNCTQHQRMLHTHQIRAHRLDDARPLALAM